VFSSALNLLCLSSVTNGDLTACLELCVQVTEKESLAGRDLREGLHQKKGERPRQPKCRSIPARCRKPSRGREGATRASSVRPCSWGPSCCETCSSALRTRRTRRSAACGRDRASPSAPAAPPPLAMIPAGCSVPWWVTKSRTQPVVEVERTWLAVVRAPGRENCPAALFSEIQRV